MRTPSALLYVSAFLAPVCASAQEVPPQVVTGAVRAVQRAVPILQGEVDCRGCKTRRAISAYENRERIVRGAAAIGGPFNYETTPAYCRNQGGRNVCYNSRGQVNNGR